jgi:transposase
MGHKKGESRDQKILFPDTIDDYIENNNPVRFLDAFVEHLDAKRLEFKYADAKQTGRPPYDPKDLLKLYIYGYLNRVRTSRRLEKETYRNVEVIWLMRGLKPDFKTIAEFRKNNKSVFKKIFREFNKLCRKMNLFGNELLAIDGSKFKASNNKNKNYTENLLKIKLNEIDEKIDKYFKDMDELDEEESENNLSIEELQKKISNLDEKKEYFQKLNRKIKNMGERQISLTDPDSRSFPNKYKVDVGYNAQIAVDEKHHLIAEQDVTNNVNDTNELSKISINAKHELSVEKIKVVADAGFSNVKEIKACEGNGIEAYVPIKHTSINIKRGLFSKDDFKYNAKKNCYICPAGEILYKKFERNEKRRNKRRDLIYYLTNNKCRYCPIKDKCTSAKYRRITRTPEDYVMDLMHERLLKHPHILKTRKEIVEHVFGTMKFWNEQDHFLMRGLEKVKSEFSLSALAYNITRVINIMGVERMIEALG